MIAVLTDSIHYASYSSELPLHIGVAPSEHYWKQASWVILEFMVTLQFQNSDQFNNCY